MLELQPNQDVDVTVKECFSLDNEVCLIFQKYDEDWGGFINVPGLNQSCILVHVKLEKFSVQICLFFLKL